MTGDGEPEAQAASARRLPAAAKSAPPAMVSVTQFVLIIGGTSFVARRVVAVMMHDRAAANTSEFRVTSGGPRGAYRERASRP